MAAPVSTVRALAPLLGLTVLLLVAGLALRRAAPGLLHGITPDATGALACVLAGGLLAALGAPRQAVVFGTAYTFGALAGGALALAAQLLGCALDYGAARLLAGRWRGPRLARLRAALAAHPFRSTLTLRLLPLGNNLLTNLAAGSMPVPAFPFLAASAIGYLPQTIIFALLGSGTAVDRRLQLALAVLLFATATLLGVSVARRTAAP